MTTSVFSNESPYYLKVDTQDVEFAILDIPNRDTTYCKVTIIKENKIYSKASFDCDYSNFEEKREIMWEGVTPSKFAGLAKKQLESINHFKVISTKISVTEYQLTLKIK